ncbi:neutral zinc metallopeptidase [Azoarcus olearius]|uniref:Conserved hypothetical metallopeptidase n=1 Tax=Azoarcus sp. (strain BH72) TaxID=418699 RepID=A1K3A3_AZOSB|nr:neutral zinc metallopeptidase [Azoarcus olearius]ANQ83836.1 metallopeptidase [Azoarcus olearius]CAL93308.1 conserved hypothetical metallopeptidase [Azoarcus olearius]
MRFDHGRESDNIEDRRGEGGGGFRLGGGGKLGLGGIVLTLVALYFGVDPALLLQTAEVVRPPAAVERPASRPQDEAGRFVSMVLADTEDTWSDIFSGAGRTYQAPRLVLFSGVTGTACGTGQAAMGPFYCPADQKVYIDLSFYDDLQQRFRAPGDFAQAYVIAHEIGHHVQNLLGVSERAQRARARLSPRESNALSVRLELQADCFAGVWAHHADRSRQVLEAGDVEEALTAAAAIGDDRLQKQAQGYAVPDSFTHGSAEQRVRWFRTGLQHGSLQACDTFAARSP